jgi:hypothetical protein
MAGRQIAAAGFSPRECRCLPVGNGKEWVAASLLRAPLRWPSGRTSPHATAYYGRGRSAVQ